jgi:hypothetical protein
MSTFEMEHAVVAYNKDKERKDQFVLIRRTYMRRSWRSSTRWRTRTMMAWRSIS